jgi:tetratricopeptide (TPR) repeat protein
MREGAVDLRDTADRSGDRTARQGGAFRIGIFLILAGLACGLWPAAGSAEKPPVSSHLKRARVYLAAGDYRRALEACQREVDEAPSAASYAYLTYVYQAIDGYLEHLAKEDRWVAVEHVYRNLTITTTQDAIDPPEVLARIAKEMIQDGVRRQSEVTAAMANRLDREAVDRLWKLQTAWRAANPNHWWAGVPEGWNW